MAGEAELEQTALRMALALQHRGPDDQGTWADEHASLALAHRRLAILDLSSEGHQPMHSADKRYVLVFNGEIYNFEALRNSLEQRGHPFRGRSDTEVMLGAFCQWGIFPALERFVGMFAFALWDRWTRRLHLARDRAGEKPLYYGWCDGAFVFGIGRTITIGIAAVEQILASFTNGDGYIQCGIFIRRNFGETVPPRSFRLRAMRIKLTSIMVDNQDKVLGASRDLVEIQAQLHTRQRDVSKHAATVDLDALPRPAGVALSRWLNCFPSYGFLLCVPPGRESACLAAFAERDLAAAVVGTLDDSAELALCRGTERALVLRLDEFAVTGLPH